MSKTQHRIKSLVYSRSQGVAMVSDIVATRSWGSEKRVDLVEATKTSAYAKSLSLGNQ